MPWAVLLATLAVQNARPAFVGRDTSPLPWHLADVALMLPNGATPLTTLSVDFHLLDDVPHDTLLFLVPLSGFINGRPFYVGHATTLQNGFRVLNGRKLQGNRMPAGFVFTRWGDMQEASVRRGYEGYSYVGDHEGSHATVKFPRPMRKGKYTYRLARMEEELTPDGWVTWFGAYVHDYHSECTVFIGALRFPGLKFELSTFVGNFAEVFGPNDNRPTTVPRFRMAVGDYKVNGVSMGFGEVNVTYPTNVPQVAEAKLVRQFIVEGTFPSDAGLPTSGDAVGIMIRPGLIDRKPGFQVLLPAIKR